MSENSDNFDNEGTVTDGNKTIDDKNSIKKSEKDDTRTSFKLNIGEKHSGNYKKYKKLKKKFEKLKEKTKKKLHRSPFESIDPQVQEGLVMAMADMLAYRPQNPIGFMSEYLGEYNNEKPYQPPKMDKFDELRQVMGEDDFNKSRESDGEENEKKSSGREKKSSKNKKDKKKGKKKRKKSESDKSSKNSKSNSGSENSGVSEKDGSDSGSDGGSNSGDEGSDNGSNSGSDKGSNSGSDSDSNSGSDNGSGGSGTQRTVTDGNTVSKSQISESS